MRSLVSWSCLGLGSNMEKSEEVDEVEGRSRAFSGEVLGLVGLSGVFGLIWRIDDVVEVGRDDGALRRLQSLLGCVR